MAYRGGANSIFLGSVSVGESTIIRSNSIETVYHQKNPSNNVKYITHMQRVPAKKMEMYTKIKRGDLVKIIWYPLKMRP